MLGIAMHGSFNIFAMTLHDTEDICRDYVLFVLC